MYRGELALRHCLSSLHQMAYVLMVRLLALLSQDGLLAMVNPDECRGALRQSVWLPVAPAHRLDVLPARRRLGRAPGQVAPHV
ncbi:MAG: hypothetical protein DYG89_49110, partial [Caldilinea sp. CFX5]|nr:hypothetical protein [Caldilinea sp. CFX5]